MHIPFPWFGEEGFNLWKPWGAFTVLSHIAITPREADIQSREFRIRKFCESDVKSCRKTLPLNFIAYSRIFFWRFGSFLGGGVSGVSVIH